MELNDQEVGFRQARVAANRRKLVVCLACSFAAACLVVRFPSISYANGHNASEAARMSRDCALDQQFCTCPASHSRVAHEGVVAGGIW